MIVGSDGVNTSGKKDECWQVNNHPHVSNWNGNVSGTILK